VPTSWGNEWGFIREAFNHFSHYGWYGKSLYLGGFVPYNDIPWHFLPVLLWATTPLSYSILFVIGIISQIITMVRLVKHKSIAFFNHAIWKYDILISLLFITPLCMVIVLKSVVYESWRHVYFIYFPFMYVTILGIQSVSKKLKKPFLVAIIISVITTGIWMVKNHPYQYLYFNPIARINASSNFERDYWGVVSLDMIEFILANDQRPQIKLMEIDFLHKPIDLMVSKDIKKRFIFVRNKHEADYVSHLFHNTKDTTWTEQGFKEIKRIEVDNVIAQILFAKAP
jgi:hypothetical protein